MAISVLNYVFVASLCPAEKCPMTNSGSDGWIPVTSLRWMEILNFHFDSLLSLPFLINPRFLGVLGPFPRCFFYYESVVV